MGYEGDLTYRYIGRLSNRLRRALDALASRDEYVAGTEGLVLNYLVVHSGVLRQKDIEEEFDMRSSTASVMLRSMENKGLIVRSASASDGRVRFVEVTELGRRHESGIRQGLDEIEARLTAGLSVDEREVVLRALRSMVQNLD